MVELDIYPDFITVDGAEGGPVPHRKNFQTM
jgi:glutamate synthase domain-containing protein 2